MNNNAYYGFNPFWNFGSQNCAPQDWTFFNNYGWNTPNYGWNTPGFGGNFNSGWNGSNSFGWNTPNFGWNTPGFGGNFGNWNNGAAFSAPNWWGFADAPTQQSGSFDPNTNTNGYATSMWGTPEGQSARDAA